MADSIKVICDNLGGPIRVAMGTPLSDVAAQLTPGRYPFLAAFVNNRIKELNYKIYTLSLIHIYGQRLRRPGGDAGDADDRADEQAGV